MSGLIWHDSFSVNIEKIDEQHQGLFKLINELDEAMLLGKGKSIMGDVLNRLTDYTVVHFKTEEDLFQKYAYPDYDAHKKEHDDLVAQVVQVKENFDAGKMGTAIDTSDFLRKWITNHIKGTDKKYSAFLNSKGVS